MDPVRETLEGDPETFHRVDMNPFPHVFSPAMIDAMERIIGRETGIGMIRIGINFRPRPDMGTSQGFYVLCRCGWGGKRTALTIPLRQANRNTFGLCTPSWAPFCPFARMFILLLPPNRGLVNLNNARKQLIIILIIRFPGGLTNTLQHKRLLRGTDELCQLNCPSCGSSRSKSRQTISAIA